MIVSPSSRSVSHSSSTGAANFWTSWTGGSQRNRFTHLCFESNLTESQETQILDLMDEVSKSIEAGTPMNHHDFEERIYEIVPHRAGSYSFAETIVSVLNREGRWPDVFQHMKKNGMNFGS